MSWAIICWKTHPRVTMKFLVLAVLVAGATAATFPAGKVPEPSAVKPSAEIEPVKEDKPAVATEKVAENVQSAVPQGRSFSGFSAPRSNYNNNNQQGRYDQYQRKPQPYKPYVAIDPVPVRPVEYVSKNVNYGPDQNAEVLKSVSEVGPEGFNYAYETANGISADAQGSLRTFDDKQQGVVVQGSYRYTAPDGTPVVVTYIADENGYQPQSDLLPQAPPLPEAIARSLDFQLRNTQKAAAHAH